ncbi:hypothetical protein IE53DRAFT_130698 [Violaceomyces palustris]|uniref:Uncharacterized protein n=1 Tax=Violaceomyces palustris TaxID=1673888 RepID=A0ACD0NVB5_9BASI|nr:hypothetical protein IE53DRAFT_130698 [Violaceomyces palustris]
MTDSIGGETQPNPQPPFSLSTQEEQSSSSPTHATGVEHRSSFPSLLSSSQTRNTSPPHPFPLPSSRSNEKDKESKGRAREADEPRSVVGKARCRETEDEIDE